MCSTAAKNTVKGKCGSARTSQHEPLLTLQSLRGFINVRPYESPYAVVVELELADIWCHFLLWYPNAGRHLGEQLPIHFCRSMKHIACTAGVFNVVPAVGTSQKACRRWIARDRKCTVVPRYPSASQWYSLAVVTKTVCEYGGSLFQHI